MMMEQQSWFECPVCTERFNEVRVPMIICMAQHTICKLCLQGLMNKHKDEDYITCTHCRALTQKESILEFRWLRELNNTKSQLRKDGSKIRRQNAQLMNDKKKLYEELMKEMSKNEWLIQLQDKPKKEEKQNMKSMMKQVMSEFKKQMKEQRIEAEKANRQNMRAMLNQTKELIRKEFAQRDEEREKQHQQNKKLQENFFRLTEKTLSSFQVNISKLEEGHLQEPTKMEKKKQLGDNLLKEKMRQIIPQKRQLEIKPQKPNLENDSPSFKKKNAIMIESPNNKINNNATVDFIHPKKVEEVQEKKEPLFQRKRMRTEVDLYNKEPKLKYMNTERIGMPPSPKVEKVQVKPQKGRKMSSQENGQDNSASQKFQKQMADLFNPRQPKKPSDRMAKEPKKIRTSQSMSNLSDLTMFQENQVNRIVDLIMEKSKCKPYNKFKVFKFVDENILLGQDEILKQFEKRKII